MSLFDFENPDDKPVIIAPEAMNPPLKGKIEPNIALDTLETPVDIVTTQISGYKQDCIYIRQVLTGAMEPAAWDRDRSPVNQPYLKISNFQLKVQSGLQSSQDNQTKEITLNGTAIIEPGLIPIKGDMIVIDTGDQLPTLFTVIETRRLSNNLNSAYEIDYRSVIFYTPDVQANIEAKVVERKTYNAEFYNVGRSPFLNQSSLELFEEAKALLNEIPLFYFNDFYNDNYGVFLLPDVVETTYDPHLSKFVSMMFPVSILRKMIKVENINSSNWGGDKNTVFDTLITGNPYLDINRYSHFTKVTFQRNSFSATSLSLEYTGISHCMVPSNEFNVNESYYPTPLEKKENNYNLYNGDLITLDSFVDGLYSTTDVITKDVDFAPYVLSEAFYDNTMKDNRTILEKMIINAISNKTIGLKDVVLMAKMYMTSMSDLNKYYHLPIIYFLLNKAIKEA